MQHPTSEQAGDHWDENAALHVSVSDDSNGGEWVSYSLGSLFLGKALPELGELIILPSLLGASCPPVPRGKGGADQVQRCCSTFLGALPLGVALYLSVMLPRYTREWMENSSGTKGLYCVASEETCSFPGREHRRLSPCLKSQMLATCEHWEEGGAGLNCRALGTHRKADFCLLPKMQSHFPHLEGQGL